jgi:hypothetical protein
MQAFIDGFVNGALQPGGELSAHNFTAAQLTLVAYRFVLNRDPDPQGFAVNRDYAAAHGFSAMVSAMAHSAEFTGQVLPRICGSDPDYGSGTAPATTIPDAGPAALASDRTAELQQQLDTATGPVSLDPGAVYGLSAPLVIPPGVELTTTGSPGPSDYPRMARLVRLATFTAPSGDSPLVRVEGTGELDNVWVDGQRSVYPGQFDPYGDGGMDVELRGGATIEGVARDDRLTNAAGRMVVTAWGGNDGVPGEAPCAAGATVAGNLIDGYASVHLAVGPGGVPSASESSDGIQVWCGSTAVYDNAIVDTTDAPIVLFAPAGGGAQASDVHDNTIVSAGNSSFYGIVADPLAPGTPRCDEGGTPGGAVASKNYTGTDVHGNHLWTGDRTHINVLLSLGTHEALGSCEHPGAPNGVGELNGIGAVFANNDDDGLETRTEIGIYVGGMLNATVAGTNRFGHILIEPAGMPLRANIVVATGTATSPAPNYAVGLSTPFPYTSDTGLIDDHTNNDY